MPGRYSNLCAGRSRPFEQPGSGYGDESRNRYKPLTEFVYFSWIGQNPFRLIG
jgi:hypothetical protein